ncbi:MAG TPA: hypothetical protein VGP72_30670 [Planctomycetota bacterium]|jgi:hypothetical protein
MLRTLTFLFAGWAPLLAVAAGESHDSSRLHLVASGEPRPLPDRIFGASVEPFVEHMIGDPAKTEALKKMHIGLTRFPGGSQSNFYDWRTGLFEIHLRPDSSEYMHFWAKVMPMMARRFPKGISAEEYKPFVESFGAESILVPNLETSTVQSQAQWFKRLAQAGAVPTRIELGNEFYIAMGNDPAGLEKWPNEPVALRTMKEYYDAIKPFLPKGAKVAVQAAGAAFHIQNARGKWQQRMVQWDADLKPEPWFDAVTVHLYPRLADVLGEPGADEVALSDKNAVPRLQALMAHMDSGVGRVLADIEKHLPSKEIWVTEWNPHGATTWQNKPEPTSPAMALQLVTRTALVYLRFPSVTHQLFFMFTFYPKGPHTYFVEKDGKYEPTAIAVALSWLDEAANAGGTFQRMVDSGARPIEGKNAWPDSYREVEGAVFRSGKKTTLIIQNASAESRRVVLKSIAEDKPHSIEVLAMSDFTDMKRKAADIDNCRPAEAIKVPAYSITRVVWPEP